jgi:hypothetical protein
MIYLLYTINILLLIDYWAQSGPFDLYQDLCISFIQLCSHLGRRIHFEIKLYKM